jgi:hypothetical protein
VRTVDVPDAGSQFRSRDVFPDAVADLARGDDSLLGKELDVAPPPERSIAYIDGYGNLKTTWYEPPAPTGTTVQVRIGDAVAEAVVSDGVFTVPAGALSFAPGSSGWSRADGGGHRACYELLLRGAAAADLFGRPAAGTAVEIDRL